MLYNIVFEIVHISAAKVQKNLHISKYFCNFAPIF